MPTLVQMRDQVDTFLAAKWPLVITRQETYFTNNGRYWQGLWSHITAPAHTNGTDGSIACTRYTDAPSDQASRWIDALPEWVVDLFPMRLRIDAYNGPLGHGYVGSVQATHNGTLWERSRNEGPETWRTEAWHQVT